MVKVLVGKCLGILFFFVVILVFSWNCSTWIRINWIKSIFYDIMRWECIIINKFVFFLTLFNDYSCIVFLQILCWVSRFFFNKWDMNGFWWERKCKVLHGIQKLNIMIGWKNLWGLLYALIKNPRVVEIIHICGSCG